jgi:3-oxoacyl-[acyl-carrier-protein] synthase II
MKKRVVITGLGVVSAVGNSLPEFWNSLIEGRDGTKEITVFDPSAYRTKIAAQVSNFDPESHFSKKEIRRLSRCDQFGLIAFREAWKSARLNQDSHDKERVGVALGAGSGGILSVEKYFRDFYQRKKKSSPSLLISYSLATTTDHIAIESGLNGPRTTTATVCSSSSASIGVAFEMIQMGLADVMITGGSDSLCEVSYSGFSSLKLVDPESCKPFDKRRQGLVIGEGAGILILEELEHALAREAPIHAEFLGYGICADAYHLTAPEPNGEGVERVIRIALAYAGVSPEEVDTINAHGTATPFNDIAETRGIKRVFGEKAREIPISGIKSMVGHCLGSAGGIEAVATVMTLETWIIPPTIHYRVPDPLCDLNYTPNQSIKKDVRVALSNSFAFGGNNVCLVFGKFDPNAECGGHSLPQSPALRGRVGGFRIPNSEFRIQEGHRVVITGLGIVSSMGVGREMFWENCLHGISGIKPIRGFDVSSYHSRLGGQLPEVDFKAFIKPANLRRMDRIGKIVVSAVRLAIDDSALNLKEEDSSRIGISIGTGLGSSDTVDQFFRSLLKDGPVGAAPLLFQTAVPNAITSHCAIEYGVKGVNITFSHKESSTEMAMTFAYHLLREGKADVILTGGGDELSEPLYHVYSMLGVLSPGKRKSAEGMKPFDQDRNGIVLGEGSGILVLETLEHAKKRGAKIYAEMAGVGLSGSTDGLLRYDLKGDSIARAMSLAAGEPQTVDYISAAANSTPGLDRSETLAIKKVFGERIKQISVSSLKSMLGEFDGSGGIRACSVALSLYHGMIPPTIGTENLDPQCDLNVVLGQSEKKEIRSALLNGCSNGGSNISHWLRRYDPQE